MLSDLKTSETHTKITMQQIVPAPIPSARATSTAIYVPLFYSEKVKNPGKAHFVKSVLLGHWVFGVVAWSCISPHPVINALSLLLLTVSYWCVYEIGYQENDAIGDRYEAKPTLSSAYRQYESRIDLNTPWPWCWAIGLAIPGCFLFALSQWSISLNAMAAQLSSPDTDLVWSVVGGAAVRGVVIWLAYLVAIRVTFWIYNQANEAARIWIYPFLQLQRLFGFALLASTSAAGAMLLMAYSISRWIQYCIYRCEGDRTRFPINVSCLLLFTLMYSSLALGTSDVMALVTVQSAIAFIYCTLRASKKSRQLTASLGWIKKD